MRCCIGHVLHFRVKPSHLLRKLSATHATSSLVLDVRLLKPAASLRPLRFFRRHVPHLHSPPFRDASTQTPMPHSTDGRSGDQSPTRTPALLPRSSRALALETSLEGGAIQRAGPFPHIGGSTGGAVQPAGLDLTPCRPHHGSGKEKKKQHNPPCFRKACPATVSPVVRSVLPVRSVRPVRPVCPSRPSRPSVRPADLRPGQTCKR